MGGCRSRSGVNAGGGRSPDVAGSAVERPERRDSPGWRCAPRRTRTKSHQNKKGGKGRDYRNPSPSRFFASVLRNSRGSYSAGGSAVSSTGSAAGAASAGAGSAALSAGLQPSVIILRLNSRANVPNFFMRVTFHLGNAFCSLQDHPAWYLNKLRSASSGNYSKIRATFLAPQESNCADELPQTSELALAV